MADRQEASTSRNRGRYLTWVAIAALTAYVAIMLGPYLRSTLVRDAAVTTWINIATSPIYGEVSDTLPDPGDRVGEDGVLARIENVNADRTDYEAALAERTRAREAVAATQSLLVEMQTAQDAQKRTSDAYAAVYLSALEVRLSDIGRRLASAETQRAMFAREAERGKTIPDRDPLGVGAQEPRLRLLSQDRLIADLRAQQRTEETRRNAALDGTILLSDSNAPNWGEHDTHELDAALARARYDLSQSNADLTVAEARVASAKQALEKQVHGTVSAPHGAMLWSMMVGEGAAVDIGTPVAAWINCSVLLVDVPVADAEIPLLEIGSPATVILEGESVERHAKVVITRGSAATIDYKDLAALAKGRTRGVGQAILALEATDRDSERCPVGYAAYVDFPEIGTIDVVRARLRL